MTLIELGLIISAVSFAGCIAMSMDRENRLRWVSKAFIMFIMMLVFALFQNQLNDNLYKQYKEEHDCTVTGYTYPKGEEIINCNK